MRTASGTLPLPHMPMGQEENEGAEAESQPPRGSNQQAFSDSSGYRC